LSRVNLSLPAHARRHSVGRRLLVLVPSLLFAAGLSTVSAPPASATVVTTISTPADRTILYGRSTTITATLKSNSGTPLGGRAVVLYSRAPGGVWHYIRTVTTSDRGIASTRYAPRATRYVQLRFKGSATYAPVSTGQVKIRVRSLGASAVIEAARHKGAPYQYGAAGPYRFDCSGFTLYVYSRFGRSLPHSSSAQRGATTPVSASSRRLGDLIFFYSSSGSITHVGIYAGYGYMWHAPHAGSTVSKVKIYSSHVRYGRVS
jgi:cell wall-associated NlpC family hydrolase